LLLGIAGTVILVRRWRQRVAAQPMVEHGPAFYAMREKIRRETQL
jgi:cytochrome c-type biogenesis protein CcmH